jgi:two-component system, OmpR family, response regulator
MAGILVVDDDAHIRELVRYVLADAGFAVVEAGDGLAALEVLESVKPDLAVVDVMMPRMDGWELCAAMKRRDEFPVLMLTAKGETAQKVKGFELGADDYVVKPFDPPELLARAKSLLRRYKIESSRVVRIGSLTLDSRSRLAVSGDESLSLPLKEFELLFKLGSRPGTTFTRDMLLENLWGNDFDGTERTVDVHINRLRDRFPEDRYGFRIATIRGLGYRLEAPDGAR